MQVAVVPSRKGTELMLSGLSPLKLFLINRLRLIILTDKEELSTLSFSNKGELLTVSF